MVDSENKPCWSDPRDYSDHRVFALVTISKWLVKHEVKTVSIADAVELVDSLMEEAV